MMTAGQRAMIMRAQQQLGPRGMSPRGRMMADEAARAQGMNAGGAPTLNPKYGGGQYDPVGGVIPNPNTSGKGYHAGLYPYAQNYWDEGGQRTHHYPLDSTGTPRMTPPLGTGADRTREPKPPPPTRDEIAAQRPGQVGVRRESYEPRPALARDAGQVSPGAGAQGLADGDGQECEQERQPRAVRVRPAGEYLVPRPEYPGTGFWVLGGSGAPAAV